MSAAAVIMARRKRYVRAFYGAGALSPGTARSLAEVGQRDTRWFQQMVRQGVFVQVGDGRYYLDQAGWARVVSAQQRAAFLALGLMLILFAIMHLISQWVM